MTLARTTRDDATGLGFDTTRAPLRRARHVPGYIYDSPEVYALEKEHMFMKDWLCVARAEEIRNPGDYMTLRIMDEPVIVARDQAGTLNAFSNVCAHRGVEVATGAGNTKQFSCPYHGWSYDLTGKLVGAAYMQEAQGFDPAQCRLSPIRLDVWRGNVFVTFDSGAPPLDEFLADFERDFGILRQEDTRLAYRLNIDLDCNWKFVYENFLDAYHVHTLHGKTIGTDYDVSEEGFHLREQGGFASTYSTPTQSPDGRALFGLIPWLADRGERFAMNGFMAPNVLIFARADNSRVYTSWPIAPDKCRISTCHLVPESFFEQPDYEEKIKVYRDYNVEVLEEDRSMLASMQKAMGSRRYAPGPMSKLEGGIYHVINNHLDRIFGPEQFHK